METAGARQGGGVVSTKPADSAAARLTHLANAALPGALDTLASRHESLGKVVSYLEANYLLALHSKADKGAVEKEAHLYLNEALARVATDIDTAASNIEQYLSLECSAVHSLEQQVSLLQANLALSKDRSARARLAAFLSLTSPSTPSLLDDATTNGEEEESKGDSLKKKKKKEKTSEGKQQQRKFNEHTISTRILPMDSNNRRLSLPSYNHTNVKREILSERLSRLDHVGLACTTGDQEEPESPPPSPPPPVPTAARFSVSQQPAVPVSSAAASLRSSHTSAASSLRTQARTASAAAAEVTAPSVPVTPVAASSLFSSTVRKPPTKLTASTKKLP